MLGMRRATGAAEAPLLDHPRTVGSLGVWALAMGGSNQSLFLLGALMLSQGTAAVPLLVIGRSAACGVSESGWCSTTSEPATRRSPT